VDLNKRSILSYFIIVIPAVFLVLMLSGCGQARGAVEMTFPTFTAVPWPTETTVPPTATSVVVVTPTSATDGLAPISPISPAATPILSPTPQAGLGDPTTTNYTYKVVNAFPHDRKSFIQGLIYEDGKLYEGSGLYGESSLRRVDLETGNVEQLLELPQQFFGEGF
jgi:hypothetical protein